MMGKVPVLTTIIQRVLHKSWIFQQSQARPEGAIRVVLWARLLCLGDPLGDFMHDHHLHNVLQRPFDF